MGSGQEKRTISIKLNQINSKPTASVEKDSQNRMEDRQEVQPVHVDKRKGKSSQPKNVSKNSNERAKKESHNPIKVSKSEGSGSTKSTKKVEPLHPFSNDKQTKRMQPDSHKQSAKIGNQENNSPMNQTTVKNNVHPFPHIFPDPPKTKPSTEAGVGKSDYSIEINDPWQQINDTSEESTDTSEKEIIPEIPIPKKVISFEEVQEERKRLSQPFWDDGNRQQSPSLPYKRKKKKKGQFSFRDFPTITVMAILSAIIIGLSFGFVIKTIFTGDEAGVVQGDSVPANSQPTGVEAGAANNQMQWPQLTTEIVQAGAYSSVEKGGEVQSEMTSAGHPTSLIPSNDKFFLFIGLGPDRATAQSVGEYYKEAGVETYVKTYQVTGTTVPPTAETKAWFEEAIPLYQQLTSLSVAALSFEEALPASQLQGTEQALNQLYEQRDAAFSELPEEARTSALHVADGLKGALAALNTFNESKEPEAAKAAQQALLTTLEHYTNLIR
ncbi:hypothetical protein [Alkalihalobacillus pseudalcaliphilus]|uniref:hypothetical protein n=1 Tax=Alkalihalobacillus pseudalcaliphilus TaxID=79884 RepID=UPI00064D9259|nr:hypothetical protein [Alkalihalobacillus pseudalcaliphilus]KMK74663.1 hypothetical protein AB990_19400 [Alkalihalobacillus pseudalcaliphilus]